MKKILIHIFIPIIIAGTCFYGGILYSKNTKTNTNANQTMNRQNFGNLSQEERIKLMQERGTNGPANMIRSGNAPLSGEIISKDETSITIKLNDSGSSIVYVASSTIITKPTILEIKDLVKGKKVMVNADKNDNGSYTAKSIRLE